MSLNRRTFLSGLGATAIGALAKGSADAAGVGRAAPSTPKAHTLPAFDAAGPEEFWRAVRALFPLETDPLYLNTGGLGPVSQPVLDQVAATTRELQAHSETGYFHFEPARAVLARFLGVQPEEICFTRNATEGNCIIAAGLALAPGDEVIFESHAHPGGSFPWFNRVRQHGVVVRLFEPDHDSAEGNVARIRALITPRTKVIQVSHITCTTGLVFPVAAITALARERGLWFHVDGAQAIGMIPLDLTVLGCDSAAFCGHKWLGGPHETGVLYLRRDRLEAVAPTGTGAHAADLARLPGELQYAKNATRHEYGTRNAALITGLAAAVRLQEEIGRDRIAAHGRELATRLLTEFARVPDLTVLTPQPDELRASVTTIRHARAGAHRFSGYLQEKYRLRCRPVSEQGLEAVRISTHVFNSLADCERIIAGVRAAAREL